MTRQALRSSSFRRIGLGAAMLCAPVSGGSFAYPIPPSGTLFVLQYYSGPDHSVLVGQHVNGTCPRGPYPIDYGHRTDYSTFYFYVCDDGGIDG